jgi:outer membrane protein TolC
MFRPCAGYRVPPRVRPVLPSALIALSAALLGQPSLATAQGVASQDSVLRTLILDASPELASRRAAVQAAEARVGATGFAPPMALSVEAEEVPDGIDVLSSNVRIGLEKEFLSGTRRSAARTLAATEVSAARAALELTEQRLLAEGNRAIYRVAGGTRIALRLAAEDSLLVGAESALRARFSVGEARYVDVLRLRTERLRIQSERAQALTEVATGRRTLQTLLGGTERSPAEVDRQLEALVRSAADRFGADSLPSAPDLDSLLARSGAARLADVAVERARASRELLRAEQRPHLSGTLGLQRFDGPDGFTFGPQIGASVSLPTTARRANRLGLAAASSEVAAAEASRAATLAALRGALLAARDRYEAARTRLALFDAALLVGARQEREAALASYGAGDLSLLELIDFERALSRAEIERIQARIDAADALADLYSAAAGSPTESPTFRTSTSDER